MSSRRPLELVPRFTSQGYDDESIAARRRWAEEKTGARLECVAMHSMPGPSLRGNIENAIGAAQVPLGIAGPLVVRGEHASGTFYVPFATSEGALVSSYERGMAALARAGGVEVRLERDENRVSPAFACADVGRAAELVRWFAGAREALAVVADATSRHGRLLRVSARQLGRHVIVDFDYSTGDASGMNMAVRATEHACQWAVEQSPADSFEIFSGGESEKRVSAAPGEAERESGRRLGRRFQVVSCARCCAPIAAALARLSAAPARPASPQVPRRTTASSPTASPPSSSPAGRTWPTSPMQR
jgi:hydroxymethylglutaryl-CoA reductase (NADPH)